MPLVTYIEDPRNRPWLKGWLLAIAGLITEAAIWIRVGVVTAIVFGVIAIFIGAALILGSGK